ncbi:hypothetical protein ACRAWG_31125 [Methylobacterium sp. P31]
MDGNDERRSGRARGYGSKLAPFGALTRAFHIGIGCLFSPSTYFLTMRLWLEAARVKAVERCPAGSPARFPA